MNEEVYFVVYPGGDRTKLSLGCLSYSCLYEKDEYDLASRQDFYDEDEAIKYGKELANMNNLDFVYESDNAYLD